MWLTGLVAPRHVGSSRTRARTRVPCIGRQILNHCTTREAPSSLFPPPRLTLPLGPVPTGDKSLRFSEPSLLTQAKSKLSGICRDPCLVILGQGRPFVPPLWPLLVSFPRLTQARGRYLALSSWPFLGALGPLTAELRAGARWSRGFRLLRSKDGDPGALDSRKHGICRAAGLCDSRLRQYCDLRGW